MSITNMTKFVLIFWATYYTLWIFLSNVHSPNPCIVETTVSKDIQMLAINSGCNINSKKYDLIQTFGAVSKDSNLLVEVLDIDLWLRFIRAQAILNDMESYPRSKVVVPSNILYKSIGSQRSLHIVTILLASYACSDGAEAEAYYNILNEYVDENPEPINNLIKEASLKAEVTAKRNGCI